MRLARRARSFDEWKPAARWLAAVGNQKRLQILALARRGGATVKEVMAGCKLNQSDASHNLDRLAAESVATKERAGKEMHYELVNATVTAAAVELAHESGLKARISLGGPRDAA